MEVVIAIVVVIVLIGLVGAVLVIRRRRGGERSDPAAGASAPPAVVTHHPDPGPMTGLEDALNRLTDTSGHTIAERLDEEAPAVDRLRIPDDTGPLLRRVLDSLESHDAEPDDQPDPSNA